VFFCSNTACDLPKVDPGSASGAGFRLSLFSDLTGRRLVFFTDISEQLLRAICRIKTACPGKKKALHSFLDFEAKKT